MLLERLIKFFTSLRLTVVLLVLSLVLVFAGTLGEVHLGLYKAQTEFFRSFFIYWHPANAAWKIPVFPGGYLLGAALLLNLIAAHTSRFKLTRDKIGLWIIHAGLILLILGQLATDMFAVESQMHLRQGQMKNYSESDRMDELAISDITDKKLETVVAIPERLLAKKGDIRNDQLPFVVRVKEFYANSLLSTNAAPGFARVNAGSGPALRLVVAASAARNGHGPPRRAVGARGNRDAAGFARHVAGVGLAGAAANVHRQRTHLPVSIAAGAFLSAVQPAPAAVPSRRL